MIHDRFGQIIFNSDDLANLIMEGHDISDLDRIMVDHSVNFAQASPLLNPVPDVEHYSEEHYKDFTVEQFDQQCQSTWFMPDHYKNMDIAEYVLSLCQSSGELQRAGAELLLYQEKNLIDLLKYLKYLVDVMKENDIIWGVGRGSSVSSYVLFLIGVHRIDSLYYNLDFREFLR